MTLLSRAKAMPLPEHPPMSSAIGFGGVAYGPMGKTYTHTELQNHIQAAREQIAAEGDEVIGRLCEALERILKEPQETLSDGKALREIVRIARAALAEARKA